MANMGNYFRMKQDTLVTDKKILWLEKHGYIQSKTTDGALSYFITDKGKLYLNDKEEE